MNLGSAVAIPQSRHEDTNQSLEPIGSLRFTVGLRKGAEQKSRFSTKHNFKSQTEVISDAFRARKCFRESQFLQQNLAIAYFGCAFQPGHDVTGIIGIAGGLKGTIVVSIDKEVETVRFQSPSGSGLFLVPCLTSLSCAKLRKSRYTSYVR